MAGYPERIPEPLRAIGRRCGRIRPYEYSHEGNFDPSAPAERDDTISLPHIDQIIVSSNDALKYNARVMAQRKTNAKVPGGRQVSAADAAAWEKGVSRTSAELVRLHGIATKVRAELHAYVTDLFHNYAYADFANSVFDRHLDTLTRLLSEVAPELLDKLPAVGARLAEGTVPSIEQAMQTCRRLLTDFADVVSPPSKVPDIDEQGNSHPMTQDKVANRITGFLSRREPSNSRRGRLATTVRALYDRSSAGMKDQINPREAESLYLLTLVTIGELAEIAAVK